MNPKSKVQASKKTQSKTGGHIEHIEEQQRKREKIIKTQPRAIIKKQQLQSNSQIITRSKSLRNDKKSQGSINEGKDRDGGQLRVQPDQGNLIQEKGKKKERLPRQPRKKSNSASRHINSKERKIQNHNSDRNQQKTPKKSVRKPSKPKNTTKKQVNKRNQTSLRSNQVHQDHKDDAPPFELQPIDILKSSQKIYFQQFKERNHFQNVASSPISSDKTQKNLFQKRESLNQQPPQNHQENSFEDVLTLNDKQLNKEKERDRDPDQ